LTFGGYSSHGPPVFGSSNIYSPARNNGLLNDYGVLAGRKLYDGYGYDTQSSYNGYQYSAYPGNKSFIGNGAGNYGVYSYNPSYNPLKSLF
jgi:hypothetical protein